MHANHRRGSCCLAIATLAGLGLVAVPRWPAQARPTAEPVSYSRQIAPLLAASCNPCHGDRWGGTSKFRTVPYQELVANGKAWLPKLLDYVGRGVMPMAGPKLQPEQVALLGQWIAEGAKEDRDDRQWETMVDPEVPADRTQLEPFWVGCRLPISGYLVLEVLGLDRRVLYTQGATIRATGSPATAPNDWVAWKVEPRSDWPNQVSLRLTIKYTSADPGEVVFVTGQGQLPDLKATHEVSNLSPDPVKAPVPPNPVGRFTFWLNTAADVSVAISPRPGDRPLYQASEPNLPQGKRFHDWVLKPNLPPPAPQSVGPGVYVARFRCRAVATNKWQHDMLLRFRVQ